MTDGARSSNPLCRLRELGQSVWLDDISRPMLNGGTLRRLIQEDCVTGLTSNPVIFERAVRQADAYDADIRDGREAGASVVAIYERLVTDDLRRAADLFRPTYDESDHKDGYVSLEVSPHLARDIGATIAEAQRLWRAIARPNVLIKVPGTEEGLAAMRALIASGINVNVTLLFSPDRYSRVAEAYMSGLEDRIGKGGQHPLPHSVASFFLSRIDSMIDRVLDASPAADAARLRGETAIALAREAYRRFIDVTRSERWRKLAERGAAPQRLLWASTGTKDPAYSDVKYVEPLVAAETVNTMPAETLAAFRDHGVAKPSLSATDRAGDVAERLSHVGIDLAKIFDRLEAEGIDKFALAYDALLHALGEKAERAG